MFKVNQAFKVIQGHSYWCQQKSRTNFCRGEQQCRHYFRKTANLPISTTTLPVDHSNLRNAFEYPEIIYIKF